jgi:hypothetical protein
MSTAAATAAAGAVAGAGVTLIGGGSVKEALVAGTLGYFGAGGTIGGFSPVAEIGKFLPGAATSALNKGLAMGVLGTGIGKLSGMSFADAAKLGLTAGAATGVGAYLKGAPVYGDSASPNAAAVAAPDPTQATKPVAPIQPADGAPQANAVPESGAVSPVGTANQMVSGQGDTASAPDYPDMYFESPKPYTEPSLFDKAVSGAKNFYNENISPNRPSAEGAGFLTRYGPLAAIGMGATALAGGFKTPPTDTKEADKAQAYWDEATERAKARQAELDRLGYGFSKSVARPPQPTLVQTTDYSSIPVSGIPVYQPPGITAQPGGIPQPYNVSGLYNVPQLYSPQRAATGGEMKRFPRRTGPINGPGTGTSDSIPAMLSDGEFVFTAKAVRNAGGGSRRKGAAKMYKLMKMLEGGSVGRNA